MVGPFPISVAASDDRLIDHVVLYVNGLPATNSLLPRPSEGRRYFPPEGETVRLNLNVELAKSRVYRNRRRMARHTAASNGTAVWRPSRDLETFIALSEGYFEVRQS